MSHLWTAVVQIETIEEMTGTMDLKSNFTLVILQTELERFKFLVRSYLRARIAKVGSDVCILLCHKLNVVLSRSTNILFTIGNSHFPTRLYFRRWNSNISNRIKRCCRRTTVHPSSLHSHRRSRSWMIRQAVYPWLISPTKKVLYFVEC